MAWNEKAARQFNRQPKRELDEIDIEAERQGNATRFFGRNELSQANGRRISRETRQLNGRRKSADKRATDNLVADTAEALRARLVAEPRALRQI